MNDFLNDFMNQKTMCRLTNKRKSKNFPTPHYSIVTGKLIGYQESDDHFRARLLKQIEGTTNENNPRSTTIHADNDSHRD